jgi:hypothetical protein
MKDKIPCKECKEMILPRTVEKTGGICMACKQGIREIIEQSKEFYRKQKEYDPYRELWTYLVNKAYTVENGFETLTKEEKLYLSVGIFDGEVYNGGMYQFFSNSSGELYEEVVKGLKTLKATKSLSLLKQAVSILFDKNEPPKDRLHRWQEMKQFPKDENEPRPKWELELDEIETQYYEDPDNLIELVNNYAETTGLIQPFNLNKPE